MAWHTWLIYLVAAVGLSLTPGPNSLLALTHGALHGHRRTLWTVAGGALGFVAVIALSMRARILPFQQWRRVVTLPKISIRH